MSEDHASLWDTAKEIAGEVLDHFSELHPRLRMNREEWSNLGEMIEREVVGHFSDAGTGAVDLTKRNTGVG